MKDLQKIIGWMAVIAAGVLLVKYVPEFFRSNELDTAIEDIPEQVDRFEESLEKLVEQGNQRHMP